MKTPVISFLVFLATAAPFPFTAQKMAVKSNLLSAANGALNAGVEYAFGSKIHIRFVRLAYVRGNARKDMSTNIGSYNLNTATGLARNSTAVFGSLSQRSAVQRRREKDAFRALPLAERAPICRLAGRWRHKLWIPHHAQPPLEYRSFRRCRV